LRHRGKDADLELVVLGGEQDAQIFRQITSISRPCGWNSLETMTGHLKGPQRLKSLYRLPSRHLLPNGDPFSACSS
jgi:hypothetical protein